MARYVKPCSTDESYPPMLCAPLLRCDGVIREHLTSSANDLLTLLNELRKSDKMRGLYFLKLDNELNKFNNT